MNDKKEDRRGWSTPKREEVKQKDISIPRVNYFIQSVVYLTGASLYQTKMSILRQGLTDMSWIDHFIIAFLIFGLITWLLLTGTLFVIERKKLKENKSNVALWMGLSFIAIYLFV